MKAVMISIKPEWCQKIVNSEKTVEIRKTKPNIEPPFKCYIYCANSRPLIAIADVFKGDFVSECTYITGRSRSEAERIFEIMNGKVIGEFICDRIDVIQKRGIPENFDYCYLSLNVFGNDDIASEINDVKKSCIPKDYLNSYGEKHDRLYAWRISGLKIYEEAKELQEYRRWSDEVHCVGWKFCEHQYFDYSEGTTACRIDFDGANCVKLALSRPPQSWCYVEDLYALSGSLHSEGVWMEIKANGNYMREIIENGDMEDED